MIVHKEKAESWQLAWVDMDDDSMTGGRLKQSFKLFKQRERFCLTYCNSYIDNNFKGLLDFYQSYGKESTLNGT